MAWCVAGSRILTGPQSLPRVGYPLGPLNGCCLRLLPSPCGAVLGAHNPCGADGFRATVFNLEGDLLISAGRPPKHSWKAFKLLHVIDRLGRRVRIIARAGDRRRKHINARRRQ